jgi:hypothetical protein
MGHTEVHLESSPAAEREWKYVEEEMRIPMRWKAGEMCPWCWLECEVGGGLAVKIGKR